jgi:hypothetical protein
MQKTNKFVRNPSETNAAELTSKPTTSSDITPKPVVKLVAESKCDVQKENASKTEKAQTTPPDPKLNMSQEELMKSYNQNLLKDAVPNCPICGKVLTKQSVISYKT